MVWYYRNMTSHGAYRITHACAVLDFHTLCRICIITCPSLWRIIKVSYIKWDMNRSITECYSAALPADRQGEVFHRYILGIYDLYERLNTAFPQILFESCASGGGRFDPGILYYAPQGWTSDDTDAAERVKIQFISEGSEISYICSCM